MSKQSKFPMKAGAAVLVMFITAWFVVAQSRAFRESGEAGAKVWFYEPVAKRLYSESRNTVPPDGGGVRAVVVAFKSGEKNPRNLKVAYLESYTPELKTAMERILAARAGGKKYDGPMPSREYVQTNTLVRLVDEASWYPAGSIEGEKIMAEWRSWRGAEGQRPVVSVP